MYQAGINSYQVQFNKMRQQMQSPQRQFGQSNQLNYYNSPQQQTRQNIPVKGNGMPQQPFMKKNAPRDISPNRKSSNNLALQGNRFSSPNPMQNVYRNREFMYSPQLQQRQMNPNIFKSPQVMMKQENYQLNQVVTPTKNQRYSQQENLQTQQIQQQRSPLAENNRQNIQQQQNPQYRQNGIQQKTNHLTKPIQTEQQNRQMNMEQYQKAKEYFLKRQSLNKVNTVKNQSGQTFQVNNNANNQQQVNLKNSNFNQNSNIQNYMQKQNQYPQLFQPQNQNYSKSFKENTQVRVSMNQTPIQKMPYNQTVVEKKQQVQSSKPKIMSNDISTQKLDEIKLNLNIQRQNFMQSKARIDEMFQKAIQRSKELTQKIHNQDQKYMIEEKLAQTKAIISKTDVYRNQQIQQQKEKLDTVEEKPMESETKRSIQQQYSSRNNKKEQEQQQVQKQNVIQNQEVLKQESPQNSNRDSEYSYEGDLNNDGKTGFGILRNQKGQVFYSGDFENDKFHGQGILKNMKAIQFKEALAYEDLTNIEDKWLTYEGEFENGLRHGLGTLYFSNEEKINTKFIEGVINGEGTFYQKDNSCVIGNWENGKLVSTLQLYK